jgi:hypothetical protein
MSKKSKELIERLKRRKIVKAESDRAWNKKAAQKLREEYGT